MIRFILFIVANILLSQTSPQIGLADKPIDLFSFNNATIHISPDEILLNSNLIIKNNKIVKIGENVHIDGAIEIDLLGMEFLEVVKEQYIWEIFQRILFLMEIISNIWQWKVAVGNLMIIQDHY